MNRRDMLKTSGAAALLPMAFGHELLAQNTGDVTPDTVYELRMYHAVEGRLDDILARFRNHTVTIFNRHDMHSVAFWTPTDAPLAGRLLVYILRHRSREAATANWAKFQADPEWKAVKADSEKNGPIVEKIDSTFVKLTDFSPKI